MKISKDEKTIYVSSTEVHLTRGYLFDEVAVNGKRVIVTRYDRPYVQIVKVTEDLVDTKKVVNG